MASCSRDRTVQVYRLAQGSLDLLQTIDDHAAAVSDVRFSEDGKTLISISSDRTVIIRKLVRDTGLSIAYLCVKVITLKSSPACFGLVPAEAGALMVSTMDRQISKFDLRSGRLLSSFKATDPTTNDSILITSLDILNFGLASDAKTLLFGASSSDRAVHVYDCSTGRLVFREQGQTMLSSVKVFRQRDGNTLQAMLVSAGSDGTVFTWNVKQPDSNVEISAIADTPSKQSPASGLVKRRTLTKAEISRFQKSLEGEEGETFDSRSPSPSRVRRRTSRPSLFENRRTSFANNTAGSNGATPLPTVSHTENVSGVRARRPSLDPRRRSKSAANLNDLNDTAQQLCTSLRAFRERYESSVSEKLNTSTVVALEKELNLVLNTITESDRADQRNWNNYLRRDLTTTLRK